MLDAKSYGAYAYMIKKRYENMTKERRQFNNDMSTQLKNPKHFFHNCIFFLNI